MPDISSGFSLVAIAASAGGIQALEDLVADLPEDFPLPVLICQHVRRDRPTKLPIILARRTKLRVVPASEGDCPSPGVIHVAQSNQHLLVRADGTLGLSAAARVNFCRPAADVLFQSVAALYGPQAIGVVLTGYGQDGALGARTIQQHGGLVIAQDEASAQVFDMPRAARDIGGADLVLPLRQMVVALQVLANPDAFASPGTANSFQTSRFGSLSHCEQAPYGLPN